MQCLPVKFVRHANFVNTLCPGSCDNRCTEIDASVICSKPVPKPTWMARHICFASGSLHNTTPDRFVCAQITLWRLLHHQHLHQPQRCPLPPPTSPALPPVRPLLHRHLPQHLQTSLGLPQALPQPPALPQWLFQLPLQLRQQLHLQHLCQQLGCLT